MSTSTTSSVLLVGNFLSGKVGNYSVCEDLAGKLESVGLNVLTASNQAARAARLLDIVTTTWSRRHDYTAANVDVYSGLGFGLAEAACFVLQAAGKPYALSLRGGNLPEFGRRWPRRVGRLLRHATVVTTPSDYLKQRMEIYRNDIQLLPNPLNLSRYPFHLRDKPTAKLVWVRSFHHLYNPTLAIQLIADLQHVYPDIQLTMVGPDKGDGSLQATQQAAHDLGVSDRVQFTGGIPKTQIPDYLAQSDVFINTTNFDNTPVSVLEAMACGLCVVSTDVGGMPDLVDHNQNALLVPPGDPAAMGTAVRRVLDEDGFAEKLSRNAHAFASQFDWPAILPKWVRLFETLNENANH
ncbi:glycosyl transferase group 1 [Rhodopirellula maiorica SM1]|uniref:Glycosyl transferase group 1 n=1 Tax=Rhodopirellula maiorica SM1 TaxID=1265738 RepID=M5RE34_9BACT|nr:glycosyltransferase family 4 protein [Rhodopirellula maiorica]EMI17645.1 glycosyl transferase group 1 [Rhodopirellula maiorica SM1]